MSILTKLFGSQNERYLKSLKPIIEKINSLEADTKKLADKDFPAKTKDCGALCITSESMYCCFNSCSYHTLQCSSVNNTYKCIFQITF